MPRPKPPAAPTAKPAATGAGRRLPADFVSGFVALIGRPNAGKSTLLNALLGHKVAIVTPHPQTTRTHLLGIHRLARTARHPPGQIVFVDTPGVHKARTVFNREMMRHVRAGLEGRDLALLLVDVTRPFGAEDSYALDLLRPPPPAQGEDPDALLPPTVLVLNKVDCLVDKRALLPIIAAYQQRFEFAAVVPISALRAQNLELLMEVILGRLPPGPEYFPAGQVTDQPERFLISELVREKAMTLTREEVPHTLAVQIEAYEDTPRMLKVGAVIFCERAGQKAILIGKRGEMAKQIGTQARAELETWLGRRVFLQLHVLVRDEWRENPRFLKDLDYRREDAGA